jgi:hypothetical protein
MAVAAEGSGIAWREEAGVGDIDGFSKKRCLDSAPTGGERAGIVGRKKPASFSRAGSRAASAVEK